MVDPGPALDVILGGWYFCDLVFTGLPHLPQLGMDVFSAGFEIVPGGTYYTVTTLHRLGVRAGWATEFGNDLFSQFMLSAIRQEGLDERLFRIYDDRPLRRLAAAFSFPHDRAFVSYTDDAPGISLAPLIRQERPHFVYLPAIRADSWLMDVAEAAHQVGAQVMMDCQWTELTLDMPNVQEALRAVDVFAPNEGEALRLTGAATIDAALERLAHYTPTVVIKRGAQGAQAVAHGESACAPAIPVTVVDTTGAGDCFSAGFLYGLLASLPLEACLRIGNICGGLSTTAPGSEGAPSLDQVHDWLARYP